MRPSSPTTGHRDRARRGVTLVEMLVVVALVVLMMTILASIFQAATGAISSSRTIQELDNNLRLLDMTIREDLAGITARMTPPLDPVQNLGYFEYGENAPADLQGEDTDDYIAFTTKAPEGQFFSGRIWIPATAGNPNVNAFTQPTIITSQFAEVIYFLRNGNLYRRVLLIVPERKGQLATSSTGTTGIFQPAMFGLSNTSWMGVNDVSAHMSTAGAAQISSFFMPIPNTLGHLTNRENRFAKPRFINDFVTFSSTATSARDGVPDDGNGDGVPDFYPTLTASQINLAAGASAGSNTTGLINEDGASMPGQQGALSYSRANGTAASTDIYAFPFVNCWMYSTAEAGSVNSALGWLHAVNPTTSAGVGQGANALIINHAPLEFGDSLPTPKSGQFQTWWGPPTWRETASPNWHDPVQGITAATTTNTFFQQAAGLQYPVMTAQPSANAAALLARNMLPPLGSGGIPTLGAPFDSDGAGNTTATSFQTGIQVWEDDLIMVGVRSFDVKALDPSAAIYNLPAATPPIVYNAGYYDLGYASTDYVNILGNTTLRDGTPVAIQDGNGNPQGMGHEARMPPATTDFRFNPQRPFIKNASGVLVPYNMGDNTAGLPRLRRVWDSWSTDYTNAQPAMDINQRGHPSQPFPLDRPMLPSYPAPYPQPLRGIQIQIRVVNPKNDKVKVLTIKQDFSDKL